MSKYITDEKLREIVYDFDHMDLDLDNMELQEKHIFSDEHNKKMANLFSTWEKEEKNQQKPKIIKFKKVNRTYKMVASILIVLLLGVSVFQTDTVLAYANKIKTFIIQEFDKYSLFKFDDEIVIDEKLDLDNFILDYNSDEFSINDVKTLSMYKYYTCSNKKGNYLDITITSSDNEKNILVDTEDVKVNKKQVGDCEYNYVVRNGVVQVYYFKNNILYNIESDISLDKVFDEIEKIK